MDWISSRWVRVIIVIALAILALMFLQAYAFSAELGGWDAEARSGTGTFTLSASQTTTVTRIASRNGGPCYRGQGNGSSVSAVFGTRARWGLFAEWCANRARTKVVALRSLVAFDRGGGYFQHDPPCFKSHGGVGFQNLFTRGECHYFVATNIGPLSRNGWVRMWLGPKGGMSGTYGWSL